MKKSLLFISAFTMFGFAANAQTILGIDVSDYQGTINWTSVKNTSTKLFAWAKASEGTTIADGEFLNYEANGKAAGVYMGAYHFAHPEDNTAVAEANYFLSIAKPYIKAGYLPPVLDLEDPPSGPALSTDFTSAQLTTWVQTWFNVVYDSTGIKPMIYTDGNYAAYLNSSLNSYGLWIADPDGSPTTAPTGYLGSWTTWVAKQYSWTGAVSGISGDVDLDVFNGDTTAFNAWVGSNVVVPAFTSSSTNVCVGGSISFTDKSTSTGTLTAWKWTFTGGTPSTSTSQNPTITYNTAGTYPVKEVVTSTTGKDSITKTAYIHVIPSSTLPLSETFQAANFPPTGWTMNYPNPNDSAWHLCKKLGYSSTQCMYFPANCGTVSNITGQRQQIYTPSYSFTGVVNAEMSFEVAYEPSSVPTYSDTLAVYYSTDCGSTWTNIYLKGGNTLSTTGGSTSAGTDTAGSDGQGCFVPPNSSAWRRDSISLSAVNNKASVIFSFESRSGWGNIIYLDNININTYPTAVQSIVSSDDVKLYPNPNNGTFTISVTGGVTDRAQLVVFDALGREVYTTSVNQGNTQINLGNKPNGIYFYRLLTESGDKILSEGRLVVVQH